MYHQLLITVEQCRMASIWTKLWYTLEFLCLHRSVINVHTFGSSLIYPFNPFIKLLTIMEDGGTQWRNSLLVMFILIETLSTLRLYNTLRGCDQMCDVGKDGNITIIKILVVFNANLKLPHDTTYKYFFNKYKIFFFFNSLIHINSLRTECLRIIRSTYD